MLSPARVDRCAAAIDKMNRRRIAVDRFVIEMPKRQVAPCLRKRLEILELFDGWDARKFFAEVVFVPIAIFFGMEEAIYIVEEIFFGDSFFFNAICLLKNIVNLILCYP